MPVNMKSSMIFMIFLALLCNNVLYYFLVDATSTLKPGEYLNFTSNLVSHNKRFTLGFFTIQYTNYTHLAIWYTDDLATSTENTVWIANRNTPLMNNMSSLTLNSSGTLKIIDDGKSFIDISNYVGTSNTTAILQDSGNFVLMDLIDNKTLWQSFDHPTDTLLRGMRLGFNLTTGLNTTLTSSLSNSVAASGAFTLSLEAIQGVGQLVLRRRGELYWTSESTPWRTQSGITQLHIKFTNYTDGMSFTVEGVHQPKSYLKLTSLGILSEVELYFSGHSMMGTSSNHISPEFCYGYESDDSCVVSDLPPCRSRGDKFEIKTAYFTNIQATYDSNSSLSLSDCMERCWNNCSCLAFAGEEYGTGCTIWAGNEKYILDESGAVEKKYILVSKKPSKGKAWIWIIITLSILIILVVLSVLFYLMRKRRRLEGEERKRREEFLSQLITTDNVNEMEINGQKPHDLKIFSFGSITVATCNFSSENKLGEGGFGPVYKGILLDGREIAVKRLSITSRQGDLEFKNELILISKLQHTNLVRVLGFCIHQEEKMLIYEYMPNKSLDFFLFALDKNNLLDWQTRYNIIDGVAQGLLYLHKYSRMRVIHRDLKASNVLLDENMNPKIADFGMARIFKQNEIEAVTNRVVGTYGYMSPEYAMEGTFSIKSDVYSFGVLLLEIVSGRRNTSFYDMRPLNLIGHAWELWKEGNGLELKDELLGDSYNKNQIVRVIHIGLLCVQDNAMDRPQMEDVILMLKNETMSLYLPKQPAYSTGRRVHKSTFSENRATVNSVQDYAITEVEGR